jgi:uncharacterized membrane protein YkvA (DUF1232 family)
MDTKNLKEKLINLGSQRDAEGKVQRTFWSYFKKNESNISFGEEIEKIYDHLTSGKLSNIDKALIIGALIYFIDPFDLVPDVIPFVGFLDDMAVIGFVYRYLSNRALEVNSSSKDRSKEDSD